MSAIVMYSSLSKHLACSQNNDPQMVINDVALFEFHTINASQQQKRVERKAPKYDEGKKCQ